MASPAAEKLRFFLKREINNNGPMSVETFMEHVLGHPEFGYYMSRDPLGAAGDFTTAPEVSQIFGEIIGLWLADVWMQMGRPSEFILLECGPGRGTMMADILRITSGVDGFIDAAKVTLLENSPVLRAKQAETLKAQDVTWCFNLSEISNDAPILFVANEFFDALSLRQYQFNNGSWFERFVEYNKDSFSWVYKAVDFNPTKGLNLHNPQNEQFLEISESRACFMQELSECIKNQNGAGLIIDYGHVYHAYGDTLQAVKSHEFIDPLLHVGDADLTSHVDFWALKNICVNMGVNIYGQCSQGEFLKALGIQLHASRLMQKASAQQAHDIQKALHRLTHSDEMGLLFKVMGVGHAKDINPAGF